MLEYKKQMILKEISNASEEEIGIFLEALKNNKYFLKIYSKDINKETEIYLENIKSEIIRYNPQG